MDFYKQSEHSGDPAMRAKHAAEHKHLLTIFTRLPADWPPYGTDDPEADPDPFYVDCSHGCKWFAELGGALGMDWGVCANPASHRAGLLTFEHQGCRKFEPSTALLEEDDDGR